MKGVLKFLVLVALPGLATAGACLPVVGTVKLVPESTCMISSNSPFANLKKVIYIQIII